jgi:DNA repair exonuclease SbcCD ATPase subunit
MSDLNPYEESLAIDLAKANDGIKQLQQALKDQSSVSDRLAEVNEKLTAERDEHWKSFVHWRKEADVLTEQLEQLVAINEAARADAKEAEAYAEELEKEQKGWQTAAVKLMKKLTASEAKLAKAVEALRDAVDAWDNHNKTGDMMHGHWVTDARATLAEIENSEAVTLGEKT